MEEYTSLGQHRLECDTVSHKTKQEDTMVGKELAVGLGGREEDGSDKAMRDSGG